jgi:dTDP-4-dehydrorhamnose reductase
LKIAVTGAAGLFGRGLVLVLGESEVVAPLTREQGDITDALQMRKLMNEIAPDVILHSAGIPDIDECEKHPDKAWKVNADATRALVEIAADLGAAFAFISSDAVFDGNSARPYVETDPVNPPSVYGRTKVAAEEHVRKLAKHWIFRVSVLFGPGKANFVNKAWCKAMGDEPYVVANDQLGSATYTLDAAQTILQVIRLGKPGTFHVCNQGACTRYELAKRAVELAGIDTKNVIGKPVSEMNRAGPRLRYSVMEMRALAGAGITLPRSWEDALRAYARTLQERLQ